MSNCHHQIHPMFQGTTAEHCCCCFTLDILTRNVEAELAQHPFGMWRKEEICYNQSLFNNGEGAVELSDNPWEAAPIMDTINPFPAANFPLTFVPPAFYSPYFLTPGLFQPMLCAHVTVPGQIITFGDFIFYL